MLSFPHTVRIFLHTDAVDLRKSFDGLSGLVLIGVNIKNCKFVIDVHMINFPS